MTTALTVQNFVEKWTNVDLGERQSYQQHFLDVCKLFGSDEPMGTTAKGLEFIFERATREKEGKQGFADVYFENHFAIEYKAPNKYKTLDEAYQQLQKYREPLKNPPLLIVTDINNWEIHTNFSNTEKKIYCFTNQEILNPDNQRILRQIFENPKQLHPDRSAEQVTKEAAISFQHIVDSMRDEIVGTEADVVAHFLTKLVFCLFAEDIGLLPVMDNGRGIFSYIIDKTKADETTDLFKDYIHQLFDAMNEGKNMMMRDIHYFNGSLFDDVNVIGLSKFARRNLFNASVLNWEYVEPTIFGTLFERAIDPAKRAQLGAHYTSREDIMLIVEPVLLKPLQRQWADIRQQADTARDNYDSAKTGKTRSKYIDELLDLRETMLKALRDIKVLDPACGSGNFLYVALQSLLDFEQSVLTYSAWSRVPEIDLIEPRVHPKQMYGIEKNPIAHALASIVVWIGYLQWKVHNGYRAIERPILQDIHENIRNMDAILDYDEDGKSIESEWQEVDVIIGNPPFLGNRDFLTLLGEKYTTDLNGVYANQLTNNVDLVTFWFTKAWQELEKNQELRVGLVATSRINQIQNGVVLKKLKEKGDIFNVWREKVWHDGATAVRVSLICFDNGSEDEKYLDGQEVNAINANLTTGFDITQAEQISERPCVISKGTTKYGAFDIDEKTAKKMLEATNSSGVLNSDVVRRWSNGSDVANNRIVKWIIDFHHKYDRSEEEAKQYELPYKYVLENVKPSRIGQRNSRLEREWWLYESPRPELRNEILKLNRYLVTVYNSSRRYFIWLDKNIVPDQQLVAFATDNDYVMGVLSTKFHTLWSLEAGSKLGRGNTPRYTMGAVIDTFPFPYVPSQEDESAEAYQAISQAAKQLHEERDAWLNPVPESPNPNLRRDAKNMNLKDRTLTNLYNALAVWRGEDVMKLKEVARDFAPRLAELHDALDKAVCSAYGWDESILDDEEEILRHLLALNLERAEA